MKHKDLPEIYKDRISPELLETMNGIVKEALDKTEDYIKENEGELNA